MNPGRISRVEGRGSGVESGVWSLDLGIWNLEFGAWLPAVLLSRSPGGGLGTRGVMPKRRGAGKSGGEDRANEGATARRSAAFTLLEVMIAAGILFICLFASLELQSNSLRSARLLQRSSMDAGLLAAELSLTNQLSEGFDSGDFGDLYPDHQWHRDIREIGTNGLFEINFTITQVSGDEGAVSHLSIQLFRPESTRVGRVGGFRR